MTPPLYKTYKKTDVFFRDGVPYFNTNKFMINPIKKKPFKGVARVWAQAVSSPRCAAWARPLPVHLGNDSALQVDFNDINFTHNFVYLPTNSPAAPIFKRSSRLLSGLARPPAFSARPLRVHPAHRAFYSF